jgi:hypothetical protein
VLRAQGDLSGALAAYRKSLAVRERLAADDPSNATWQRDLWVSYWRQADMLERSGEKEAIDWWRRAYAVLTSMKQRGLFIPPGDEKFLDILRRKCS